MKQYCVKCVYQSLPCHEVTFKAGQFLFMEEDPLTHVYLVEKGLVRVGKTTVNGEEKTIEILGPNEFVGLVLAIRGDDKYIASAIALTDIRVRQLNVVDVKKTYQENNQFKDMCISCAMAKTNVFQSQLFNSLNDDVEERILMALMFLSDKFGLKHDDNIYKLDLPFSKTVLASIIGIRRETLSRRLSQMQKSGMITVNKNKYIFEGLM